MAKSITKLMPTQVKFFTNAPYITKLFVKNKNNNNNNEVRSGSIYERSTRWIKIDYLRKDRSASEKKFECLNIYVLLVIREFIEM